MKKIAFEDIVSVRMYTDGSGEGWQVGYKGHYVKASTKEEAIKLLLADLAASGIELPKFSSGKGSIRVAITGQETDVAYAAEYLPIVAYGPDPDEAVKILRSSCAELGVICPDRVYDVAKSISAWMN